LPHFTLIGATTRAGLLTAPLRDRFGMINRLELYNPEEISQILKRDAQILDTAIDTEGLDIISTRCRGTPRIAIRLLKRMRDFAQVRGTGVINGEIARMGLAQNMIDMFGGGPVGLDTLAACTGDDAITIEDVYEPFLMQIGYLAKTPRGRVLTRLGWNHLGIECPENYEIRLKGLGRALNGGSNGVVLTENDNMNNKQIGLDID
jgi:Holliday junction DNA helicase RuvB